MEEKRRKGGGRCGDQNGGRQGPGLLPSSDRVPGQAEVPLKDTPKKRTVISSLPTRHFWFFLDNLRQKNPQSPQNHGGTHNEGSAGPQHGTFMVVCIDIH